MTKCFLFTLRLSCSGKAVHRVFATQAQEAFFKGHLHGFGILGGIPFDKIRYDNLKAAVKRVLLGRERQESERWMIFRSHHGFDSFYCLPGPEGAHEKGGVEGEGGRFRGTVIDQGHRLDEPVRATGVRATPAFAPPPAGAQCPVQVGVEPAIAGVQGLVDGLVDQVASRRVTKLNA